MPGTLGIGASLQRGGPTKLLRLVSPICRLEEYIFHGVLAWACILGYCSNDLLLSIML